MNALKAAVQAYAPRHANSDGLATTPIRGLRMMYRESPASNMHSLYRPLVCLVLQGAKHMTIGRKERIVRAGEAVIIAADMPVVGRIVRASPSEPYIAIAVELEITTLRELAAHMGHLSRAKPLEVCAHCPEGTQAEVADCMLRLMRLLDHPEAIPLLRPGIMQELHYWLLTGPHGCALKSLADPNGHAGRLAEAIAILRAEYRERIPVERLASAAAMSLSAFHKHFKDMTSLSPGQYQKRLRLLEARRLMLDEGFSASHAAFEVGYESVSQFTREYGRLFQAPPKQDVLRWRRRPFQQEEATVGSGW